MTLHAYCQLRCWDIWKVVSWISNAGEIFRALGAPCDTSANILDNGCISFQSRTVLCVLRTCNSIASIYWYGILIRCRFLIIEFAVIWNVSYLLSNKSKQFHDTVWDEIFYQHMEIVINVITIPQWLSANCNNSIANTLELLQSCSKPLSHVFWNYLDSRETFPLLSCSFISCCGYQSIIYKNSYSISVLDENKIICRWSFVNTPANTYSMGIVFDS